MNDMSPIRQWPAKGPVEEPLQYVERLVSNAEVAPGVTFGEWLTACQDAGRHVPPLSKGETPQVWPEGSFNPGTKLVRQRMPDNDGWDFPRGRGGSSTLWLDIRKNTPFILRDICSTAVSVSRKLKSPDELEKAGAALDALLRSNQELLRAAILHGAEPAVGLLDESDDQRADIASAEAGDPTERNMTSTSDKLIEVMMDAMRHYDGHPTHQPYPYRREVSGATGWANTVQPRGDKSVRVPPDRLR